MIEFGSLNGGVLQDWSVDVSFDGTLNGFASFIFEESQELPNIGDKHPKDERLELIDYSSRNGGLNTISFQARYFGLEASRGRSIKIWTSGTSMSEEAIESHPDAPDIIGEPDDDGEGENGALFDDKGVFLGFKASSDLAGIRGYLAPTTTMRSTWYDTESTKGAETIGKVFNFNTSIPGLSSSSRNALKISWSSEPIGLNFWRITEEFLLSEVGAIWKEKIYGKAINVDAK
jgi:hypothetical protein